jgi:phytoene synthase
LDETERRNAVRRIAREGDPDRSLAALFAPSEARERLFALYAFNVELARIPDQVSEPDLGFIRLQWWREALERSQRGWLTGNPVADAFGAVLRRRRIASSQVAALIDARSFDIAEKIMTDWPTLEAYLRATAGTLFVLAAEIVGAKSENLEPAVRSAALAYGLAGLMRALPVNASKGRVHLPADALFRHGTSPEQVLAGNASEALRTLLEGMREKARTALREAEGHLAKQAPRERSAFAPLALVEPYLAALEKLRDPLRELADINPLYRLWRLARWR